MVRAFVALLLFSVPILGGEKLREPAVAGMFYPDEKGKLESMVRGLLEKAEPKLKTVPIALISPHAGYEYSGRAAAHGYKLLEASSIRRVIILGFSHRKYIRGLARTAYTAYQTPLGVVRADQPLLRKLEPALGPADELGERFEHSIEVQLPFLQIVLKHFTFVPILVGDFTEAEARRFTSAMQSVLDEQTLLVASSDFTHYGPNYGYIPFRENVKESLRKLDFRAVKFILKLDYTGFERFLEETGDTICGRNPVRILLRTLPEGCKATVLKYYCSGDVLAEKGVPDAWRNSVSYFSIAFTREKKEKGGEKMSEELSKEAQKELLRIARATVEAVIRKEAVPDFKVRNPELLEKRGVFVTIENPKKRVQLRGCIGWFFADRPVWEQVRRMAVAAATEDPRFYHDPITVNELKDIRIEISVLSPLKKIDDPLKIEMGKHGIYIKRGNRAGTYLPQVAKHFRTKEEFLSSCSAEKAGLSPDAWRDKDTEVFVYTAQVFSEEDFED